MQSVKCVAVGDGAVGKTCMMVSYTTNQFDGSYIPTVFDNYMANVMVNGKCVSLALWDTAGQEDFDRLRPLSYPMTDVFIVCYSVCSQTSFDNVKSKWLPEIEQYAPDSRVILVGTKSDLRDDEEMKGRLAGMGKSFVSTEDARALVKERDLDGFSECSSVTQENLKETFDKVLLAGLSGRKQIAKTNAKCCTIM